MFETLSADLTRRIDVYKVYPEDQTFFNKYIKGSLEFGAIATIVFRFGNWVSRMKIPVLRQVLWVVYWVLNILTMAVTGINIQANSKIGKGFVIHNFSCIFIYSESIGEKFTVNHGVTVGRIKGIPGPPQIGNNVFIGAGAKLLGPIKIGDNVVIAANSLVITDIPDGCTVVGVPARIISRDAKSDYLKV